MPSSPPADELADWHPVAGSFDVAPRHVFHGQLLGQELAVWRVDDGYVNVWLNRCPHRGVRLSVGHQRRDGAALPVPRVALRESNGRLHVRAGSSGRCACDGALCAHVPERGALRVGVVDHRRDRSPAACGGPRQRRVARPARRAVRRPRRERRRRAARIRAGSDCPRPFGDLRCDRRRSARSLRATRRWRALRGARRAGRGAVG